MITVRRFPVKREAPVDLKEMKMGADLNGAVAGVTDFEGDGFATMTVTVFLPSFNVISRSEAMISPIFI